MDLRLLARILGGDFAGHDTILCPGPGHSPRDRSLAVRFEASAPDGFIIYSHCGDDWKDCRDHVRSRLGLSAWQPSEDDRRHTISWRHVRRRDLATSQREWAEAPTGDDLARIAAARRIWDAATNPFGTLAERYLASRALVLTADLAGRVLRFHPRCPWHDETIGRTIEVPALIVAFRALDGDEISAIHRIALTPAGVKLGRRMLGVVRRAAIKLSPVAGTLAVAEGFESALAANVLGYGPAWALGSAGAVAHLPVLPGIERLILLAEHDESGASRRATDHCGDRWRQAGRRVTRVWPDEGCSDLNDELISKGKANGHD
jgi:putative DNA primase/helicase